MTKRVKVIGCPSPAFQSVDVHGGKHDLPEAEEEGEGGGEESSGQDGGELHCCKLISTQILFCLRQEDGRQRRRLAPMRRR